MHRPLCRLRRVWPTGITNPIPVSSLYNTSNSQMYMIEWLDVKPSRIKSAGLGLFVRKSVKKDCLVCEYEGAHLMTAEAIRLTDKTYLMRLGPQCYIDAKDHPEVLARYINDCRNPAGYNVYLLKLPEEWKAQVIASRDLYPGEELYMTYGSWYWLSYPHAERLSLQEIRQAREEIDVGR